MNTYEKRMVRLPADQWAALEAKVDELGGTVTADFFIVEAVRSLFEVDARSRYGLDDE